MQKHSFVLFKRNDIKKKGIKMPFFFGSVPSWCLLPWMSTSASLHVMGHPLVKVLALRLGKVATLAWFFQPWGCLCSIFVSSWIAVFSSCHDFPNNRLHVSMLTTSHHTLSMSLAPMEKDTRETFTSFPLVSHSTR